MVGELLENKKYVTDLVVNCYEVDSQKRLKPSAFMDMAQEIAYQAATALHFGYDEMQKYNGAWVISRLHFRFLRAPVWREHIKLFTWAKGTSGPFFLRDFEILDEKGESLVVGTSDWVLLDTIERKLGRDPMALGLVGEDAVCHENAIEELCPKIVMPHGIEPETVGSHTVGYSDIDFIGHTNNSKYMGWAMNAVDFGDAVSHRITDVRIGFTHETHAGDVVEIKRVVEKLDNGLRYSIEGLIGGKPSFTTHIELEK
jgi:acyl-ACP thioesterase